MIKNKPYFFIQVLLCWLISTATCGAITMQKKAGALVVEKATTAEVEDLFKKYDFTDFSQPMGEFPRIFLKRLPTDWADVEDSEEKHKTFIRILLPLALKVNESILAQRQEIEQLKQKFLQDRRLSAPERQTLENYARTYDVFSPNESENRPIILINALLDKVDIVPPTIMVVTAAIYTDWGKSRLALDYYDLYRSEEWYGDKGVKPEDDPSAQYRYKIYDSLEESIAEKALKINAHINYDYLRVARKIGRSMGYPPYSPQLAAKMLYDSNLQNVAGLIDYTFSFYHLTQTDFKPQLRDIP